MKPKDYNISSEKFVFVKERDNISDLKLDTKPISYLKDAFRRFRRNKASIVASFIIGFLLLFALIIPALSPYTVSYTDPKFRYTLPKNPISEKLGISFWDGTAKKELSYESFLLYNAMGIETGYSPIKNNKYEVETRKNQMNKDQVYYIFRLDTYHANGVVYMDLTSEQYQSIQKYQDETGIQIIYPITDPASRPTAQQDLNEANYWYRTKTVAGKTIADLDSNGDYVNIYLAYTGTDNYTSKVRVEDGKLYDYSIANQTGYKVRVHYYEYYIYYHSYLLDDGIGEPMFLFGTTNTGKDIFTCLASGARFSFVLAIIVACVNLVVGAIIGAIEGYYGGKIDLIIERITDILSAVQMMVVIVLIRYHYPGVSHLFILFLAFFVKGWIGMAGRTRTQFYRFKNQEYVLAARTLGASDKRIMFKHIFLNAIGTLITGFVLVIPGVIFSETSLSYLGIINLESGNVTSVGTLLASGQGYLVSYPHMIFFPSVFISLLMLSFNLFGNGLRDAFNPSLRGSEE